MMRTARKTSTACVELKEQPHNNLIRNDICSANLSLLYDPPMIDDVPCLPHKLPKLIH